VVCLLLKGVQKLFRSAVKMFSFSMGLPSTALEAQVRSLIELKVIRYLCACGAS
jgi:hypothetical protein